MAERLKTQVGAESAPYIKKRWRVVNRHQWAISSKAAFRLALSMVISAGLLLSAVAIGAQTTVVRVLVVPFSVNAGQELGFLQRGVSNMLVSRLELAGKVTVISAGQPGDDIAALVKQTRADYVVSGSLTVLGDKVSTDARVFKAADVAANAPVFSFGRIGSQHADVLDHIDALGAMINVRLFNRIPLKSTQPLSSAPSQDLPPQPTVSIPNAGQAPKQPLPEPITGAARSSIAGNTISELVALPMPGIAVFEAQLTGLAVGDVDGDGTVDMVASTSHQLFIYHRNKDRWVKLAQYNGTGNFIGVDTADLNNNGRQEIFVTNFDNTGAQVNSFVLEWDGNGLQRIAGQLPWYFRAVDVSQRGKVLLGQRQGMGEHFGSGLYEMVWKTGNYQAGERQPLPRNLNIFGFAYGSVRSPDKPEVVTYNASGYLQVLNPSGGEESISADRYGGGTNMIVFADEEQWDVQDYIYLSPRIQLYDWDGDGIQEIMVVNNELSSGSGYLSSQRFYAKGRIELLKWHGQGIRSIRRTLDVIRFISDTALVDLDGDGNPEMVAAVVKKARGIASKGSSYLAVFGIDPAKQ